MKYLFLSLFLIGSFFSGRSLWAESEAIADLKLDIEVSTSVKVLSGNLSFKIAAKDNKIIKIKLANNGNVREDFSLRVTSITPEGGWSQVTTHGSPLPSNSYRLHAIWHHWSKDPVKTEFQSNDILTYTYQMSSDSIFFNDNSGSETHSTDFSKGYGVLNGGQRTLYIWVEGPPSTTGFVRSITATIGIKAERSNLSVTP